MAAAILVLNAGSSSLKFSIFLDVDPLRLLCGGQLDQLEGIGSRPNFVARDATGRVISQHNWESGTRLDHQGAIDFLFGWSREGPLREHHVSAAGHRVVHGGRKFAGPVLVTAAVRAELEALIPLAPLHQPHSLRGIDAVSQRDPGLPQVACFDTSFHRTQPAVAQAFALPRRYADEGVLRYGFHGSSYEYIASVLPGLDPRAAAGRTVVAHLGNGASMMALKAGQSVATTMSFTAVDGLPMGTRCGNMDPSVLLYLMERHGLDAQALQHLIWQESGLLGVSGVSGDVRVLLASADPRAAEAIDLFVYRVGREIGSLAAALGGLDALVFTAGIGEHAVAFRGRVCREAAWLGLELDETANASGGPRISTAASRVAAWVIPTNEELMIARHTRRLVRESAPRT